MDDDATIEDPEEWLRQERAIRQPSPQDDGPVGDDDETIDVDLALLDSLRQHLDSRGTDEDETIVADRSLSSGRREEAPPVHPPGARPLDPQPSEPAERHRARLWTMICAVFLAGCAIAATMYITEWSDSNEHAAPAATADPDNDSYAPSTPIKCVESRNASGSIDATWIAFTVSDPDGSPAPYVMAAYDGSPQPLTNITNIYDNVHVYSWSPSGDRIIFTADGENDFEVFSVELDEGLLHRSQTTVDRLTFDGGHDLAFGWLPDTASRIIFMREGDIYVMDNDGSDLRNLTNSGNTYEEAYGWLPAEENLVIIADGGNIYSMDTDGRNTRNLTGDSNSTNAGPVVSPDRSLVAFVGEYNDEYGVFVMDVDGSNVRQLTHGNAFVEIVDWSPDGACLATIEDSRADGITYLVIREVDGTEVRRVSLEEISEVRT